MDSEPGRTRDEGAEKTRIMEDRQSLSMGAIDSMASESSQCR